MSADPHGERPELAWLKVEHLWIDHRYQRTLDSTRSQKLIERIAADFHWSAFHAVLVVKNKQDDGRGTFEVVDGQHRVEAAKRAGVQSVPCVVIQAATLADRARAFVDANQNRVVVNPFALHHARVLAGEAESLQLQALVDAAGWIVPKYPVLAKNMKPGMTLAIGALATGLRAHGRPVMEQACRLLLAAFPDQPGHLRAQAIKMLAATLASHGSGRGDIRRALETAGATSKFALQAVNAILPAGTAHLEGQPVTVLPKADKNAEYRKPVADRAAARKCLSCGRPFSSAGFGNRLCNSCKHGVGAAV